MNKSCVKIQDFLENGIFTQLFYEKSETPEILVENAGILDFFLDILPIELKLGFSEVLYNSLIPALISFVYAHDSYNEAYNAEYK